MTIEEAKRQRQELERIIAGALRCFTEETGLEVHGLYVGAVVHVNGERQYNVEAEVKL